MIDAIDITTSQRKTILEMVKRYLPDTEVWAYGSRVKWTSRPESDLDMVVFVSPDQKRQVSDLKEALEESDLPFRVDVFEWDEVPEGFRENIEAEHVVLQEKREEFMGSEWRQSTWGEEISLEYGKGLRDYKDAEGQYRVYGSNGPVGWTYKSLAPGPGVILGRKGVYRGVEYSQEPFFVIDTAYYVKPKTNLHMRWLYYAIKYYKLGEIDDGSPIPSTTRAAVYVRELQVPPPETQRAIAHILGSLDDKIELNRQMNRTLEKMAQAIFKSWFIDFDPVHAKAEGRDPGLPKDIADLFPDSFEDSELGEIPQGWKVRTLRDLAGLNVNSWTTKTLPDEIHYVDLANTKNGVILGLTSYQKESAPSRARRILQAGDTIIGTVRPDNRSFALIGETPHQLTASTGFAVLTPIDENHREFVYLQATEIENIARLARLADGAAYPAICANVVGETKCVVPSKKLMVCFHGFVGSMFDQYQQNVMEAQSLASTRDTLLPKLISGELRVPDADKLVEVVE